MERVLAAVVAVLLVVDVLVVAADAQPPAVAIEGTTVADEPSLPVTPVPVATATDVLSGGDQAEVEPDGPDEPVATPEVTPSAIPSDVPVGPLPERSDPAEGTTYGPAVFTTSVTTDVRHYYDDETVHITVEVCNPEDHAVRRQYFRHEPARVFVIDYWHDSVASVGLTEDEADAPVRRETWSPRECRSYDYEWTLWAGPAENRRGRAREGTFRIDAEAHGYNDPMIDGNATRPGHSAWFGHHHGPRPDEEPPPPPEDHSEEPPPPPEDHSEEPGFSLSVTTDRSSYGEGETVATTVTACNETGQEQRHEVTADPPLTVRYTRVTPEGTDHVAGEGQEYDRLEDDRDWYEVFEITFGPHECRTYLFAWDQRRNDGPEGDRGTRTMGTYYVEALWDADWTGRPAGHHAVMYAESPRFELH